MDSLTRDILAAGPEYSDLAWLWGMALFFGVMALLIVAGNAAYRWARGQGDE